MLIIKWFNHADTNKRPQLAVFVGTMGTKSHPLYKHILVNVPIHAPNRKREAKWLNPKDIWVEWVKEFIDA